jgi:hypothetical protein
LRGIECQLRSIQFLAAFPVINGLATAAATRLHDGGAASSISPRLLQESTHGRENQGKNEKGENVKKERRDSSPSYRGEETDPNNLGTITNVSGGSAVRIKYCGGAGAECVGVAARVSQVGFAPRSGASDSRASRRAGTRQTSRRCVESRRDRKTAMWGKCGTSYSVSTRNWFSVAMS